VNTTLLIALGVVVLVVMFVLARIRNANRAVDVGIEGICRELGVPNRPFDLQAAVREVEAGTRPGIPRDGRWWVAMGLGEVGRPSRTRLIEETTAPNEQAVFAKVETMFLEFGGRSPLPPYLAEGRFVGPMNGVHPDIVYARITGRMRPIESWLVAVPPTVIASGLRY
jgi:hypothetical protein